MTQLALASTRRRAGLALVLVLAATLAPIAFAPSIATAPPMDAAAAA